jgi:hydrogenase nickel incorporation protein HypA/HybF
MHEMSLISDLVNKMEAIAQGHNASKINRARVRLGALSHISVDHFREHFSEGSKGTAAEDAQLEIEVGDDVNDPRAQDILLLSVDVE